MPLLELPHTAGCLVCGHSNIHGLKLSLHVDPATSIVHLNFTPKPHHIGFQGITHGGILATVVDEAMVWAATWHGKRFCVAGEINIRFRQPARVDDPLTIEAKVDSQRSKIIHASADILDSQNKLIASATGKFVQVPEDQNQEFLKTLIDDSTTRIAAQALIS
jgi:uncharacterized protein (TIGR00369 family)